VWETVARAWDTARKPLAARYAHANGRLPLVTSWEGVTGDIFGTLAKLGPPTQAGDAASAAALLGDLPPGAPHQAALEALVSWTAATIQETTVYRGAAVSPDALGASVCRAFFQEGRCGIVASIRNGKLALLAPFANPDYVNAFHDKLGSARVSDGCRPRMGRRQLPLPVSKWWLNGPVICDEMPADVWGAHHLAELEAMLVAAQPLPDCDFLINKRDFPVVTRCGAASVLDPILSTPGCTVPQGPAHAPVLSFYSGPSFGDVLLPVTEDWRAFKDVADREPRCPYEADAAWHDASPVAGFRGGPTGHGVSAETNARLALAEWAAAARPGLLDFGFTSASVRDRFVPGPHGCTVGTVARSAIRPMVPFLTPESQAAKWKYLVYADGHSASNRYGTLMASGRTILKVASSGYGAWTSWIMPGLVGARVGPRPAEVFVPRDADHFIVDADLGNLEATITYLQNNDHTAWTVARCAWHKAPTTKTLVAAVRIAVAAAAQCQLRHLGPVVPVVPWYTVLPPPARPRPRGAPGSVGPPENTDDDGSEDRRTPIGGDDDEAPQPPDPGRPTHGSAGFG
jgi:hypothetical protein